tara:strand:+ start:1116 stop:1289 length:174 start_codon:yes stop_codon:yes gene_type:complete
MYPLFTYNTADGIISFQAENNVEKLVDGTTNLDFDEIMEAYSIERNRIKSVNGIVEI